ncbi:MAG: ribosomal protein [Candidatus Midichloriaceae bacterium]|jgi:large subunit ribosomal protein L19|nr:ribosomal protein [Candidatus Midichloriaceae bacterium]
MNLLTKFEQKYITELKREIPRFRAGDTIKVGVRIMDGADNYRVQNFEGLVIRVKNRALGSSFAIKKISNGEGVERNFLTYSPIIDKIEVIKRGKVRRAKLYYMRSLQGKAARIKEIVDRRPAAAK